LSALVEVMQQIALALRIVACPTPALLTRMSITPKRLRAHTIQALRDAEAYEGPSLVLAYSHCIAHGFDLRDGMKQQHRAVASGYWPLFRYDPRLRKSDMNPFRLDSTRPRLPVAEYAYRELRYRILAQTRADEARVLMRQAQAAVDERYRLYEDMAARDGTRFHPFWQDDPVAQQAMAKEATQ
jgi:pyruvate-ferredoxin/flavodoxin oxidoreductase